VGPTGLNLTDLARLTVSLTKHGAHKVAEVLKRYATSDVLKRVEAAGANRSQALKNLSASPDGSVPSLWDEARALGPAAVDALVLVAIIFSHHQLISAMRNASDRRGAAGLIERGKQLSGKEYTNFVRILDQLGYGTPHTNSVSFDLASLRSIPKLGPLILNLLKLKLGAANWAGQNDPLEEVIRLRFHEVFGIAPDMLRDWLRPPMIPDDGDDSSLLEEDRKFFEDDATIQPDSPFVFSPGHRQRQTTPTRRSGSAAATADQLHNDIQNRLYDYLVSKFGADHVGTENATGGGTAIDVVTRKRGLVTFYEIKTGRTVRACIRQALPQLLEYAYWPEAQRADALVVVSHLPVTPDAEKYLQHLRAKFSLPLSYLQFDMNANVLR